MAESADHIPPSDSILFILVCFSAGILIRLGLKWTKIPYTAMLLVRQRCSASTQQRCYSSNTVLKLVCMLLLCIPATDCCMRAACGSRHRFPAVGTSANSGIHQHSQAMAGGLDRTVGFARQLQHACSGQTAAVCVADSTGLLEELSEETQQLFHNSSNSCCQH